MTSSMRLFLAGAFEGNLMMLAETALIGAAGGGIYGAVQNTIQERDPYDSADPRLRKLRQLTMWDVTVPGKLTELLQLIARREETRALTEPQALELSAVMDMLGTLYEVSLVAPKEHRYIDIFAFRLKQHGNTLVQHVSLEFGGMSPDDRRVNELSQELYEIMDDICVTVQQNVQQACTMAMYDV